MGASAVKRWMVEAGSAALALALALIVWASAERESNPVFVMRGVPVVVRGIEAGLALSAASAETVDVQGRAPESFWETGSEADFEVFVDLARLGPGQHVVDVQGKSLRDEALVTGVMPEQITVDLARVISKTVTVRAEVMDSAAVGYDWGTPSAVPPQVQLKGLEQYVDAAVSAVAPTYLRGAKSTVERRVAVSVRDSSDQPLGNLIELEPRMVTVTVPIEQRAGYRDLPVRARWEGQPAEGYRISEVSVDPSTVTVFGSPVVVQEIPGYVEADAVSIDEADAEVLERVALIVPENVSVLGVQSVLVRVGIVPVEESAWVDVTPKVRGLDDRWQVELSPHVIEILVAGPLPKLEALRPAQVQAMLDLTGLDVGTYRLTPSVTLPEGLREQTLVPETVEVRVVARSSPAASGTPVASGAVPGAVATPRDSADATPVTVEDAAGGS